MEAAEYDTYLRSAALAFLDGLIVRGEGVIRFEDVAAFEFDGQRIPLMDRQRGIRKTRGLDAALSLRTVHAPRPDMRPYDDGEGPDGYLRYKWRGDNPLHGENIALRKALEQRLPLIWFHGIASGLYLPVYPVWLVGEESAAQQFGVAVAGETVADWSLADVVDLSSRRRYAERTVRSRLHQPGFRARVLYADASRCALCRLRHVELLDAAHILADVEGGEPVVPNGIAMCKIHHAAFDHGLIGISPDFRVDVRADIRREVDGPTLRHALQGVQDQRIEVPSQRAARPNRDLLADRYERFLAAG